MLKTIRHAHNASAVVNPDDPDLSVLSEHWRVAHSVLFGFVTQSITFVPLKPNAIFGTWERNKVPERSLFPSRRLSCLIESLNLQNTQLQIFKWARNLITYWIVWKITFKIKTLNLRLQKIQIFKIFNFWRNWST